VGRLELNDAIDKGKQGVVSAHTYIIAGVDACTSLPNQYRPGIDSISGVSLDTESL